MSLAAVHTTSHGSAPGSSLEGQNGRGMKHRKHISILILAPLILSLTGYVTAALLWEKRLYVIRLHAPRSEHGCRVENETEFYRLWPFGGAVADGQLVLGCDQEQTIMDVH